MVSLEWLFQREKPEHGTWNMHRFYARQDPELSKKPQKRIPAVYGNVN
jgi:hypothetical protein